MTDQTMGEAPIDERFPNETGPFVRDIMRAEFPVVSPDDSVATVATLLAGERMIGVPVVEDGTMVGIVTESDLIAREADVDAPMPVAFFDAIFAPDAGRQFDDEVRAALAVDARQLMSSPVVSIRESATLMHIATLMVDEGFNPVPVLSDDDQLVGLVSRSDLVRVIAALESGAIDAPGGGDGDLTDIGRGHGEPGPA